MPDIILNEDKRSQLLSKSKAGDNYAPSNQALGKNRYERRLHSHVANSVKEFNSINMNKFFKEDILDVNVIVNGETNDYIVRMSFGGIVENIKSQIQRNNGQFNLRSITRALIDAFNRNDVYIHCTCPDWKYRFDYWATYNDITSGDPQNDPGNFIVNPSDTKGAGCKHTLIVLSNNTWLIKVSSVIYNYVNYMEKHYNKLYADIIYPALFDKEYEKDVQLDLNLDNVPEDELQSDDTFIDTSNKWARTKGQFKKGNQSGIRFASDKGPKQLNIDGLADEEPEEKPIEPKEPPREEPVNEPEETEVTPEETETNVRTNLKDKEEEDQE